MRFKTYAGWFQDRVVERKARFRPGECDLRFSVLTTVYVGTDDAFFRETSHSVLSQSYEKLEWIVLAHGPVSTEMSAALEELEREPRCRIFRIPENLGIVGGMRYCLARATGDYVVSVDADDLLTPDALELMAPFIVDRARPSLVYSDEDHLVDGVPESPFLRPNWDPVLLHASSYIWHLCAFRRDEAERLDIYGDRRAEWCHDWDTCLRFLQNGSRVAHIPEVLYHWRTHSQSSTNRPDPESGSLKSQHHVLQRQIESQPRPDLFEVCEFPLFRGAPEWWIARRKRMPGAMDLAVFGTNATRITATACGLLKNSSYPFRAVHLFGGGIRRDDCARMTDLLCALPGAGTQIFIWPGDSPRILRNVVPGRESDWLLLASERVHAEGEGWAWEFDKLFRLHPGVAAVAGRVLDGRRRVLAGAEVFGFDGVVGCPEAGRLDSDPGYFAIALKQRCVSAPYAEFCAVRVPFLRDVAENLHQEATWAGLGAWLGCAARAKELGVAFTPAATAILTDATGVRMHLRPAETEAVLSQYGAFVPDERWYSKHFGWNQGRGHVLQL